MTKTILFLERKQSYLFTWQFPRDPKLTALNNSKPARGGSSYSPSRGPTPELPYHLHPETAAVHTHSLSDYSYHPQRNTNIFSVPPASSGLAALGDTSCNKPWDRQMERAAAGYTQTSNFFLMLFFSAS